MAPWWKPWARSRRQLPEARQDGWQSALLGVGTQERDPRTAVRFGLAPVTDVEAADLWRGNDIAKKVIEVIPGEMLRAGGELRMQDKAVAEKLTAFCEDLEVDAKLQRAEEFQRAYGGAAIMPYCNDGAADLREPLREQNIMEIEHLTVFEPRELSPATYYDDPRDRKYGEPMTYRLHPIAGRGAAMMQEIHESRLIIWPGIRVTRDQPTGTLAGWGDSVLTSMNGVLRDFGLSWEAAAILMTDFAQAVVKVQNLSQIFATDNDKAFYKKMQSMAMSRSVLRMLVLDSNEEYERKATPMTGLPELLDRFATRLAAAADMPVTRLFGQSPAGLNATGESDTRFFYDTIGRHQKGLRPRHERLLRLIMLARNAPTRGKEPDLWSVEYCPLYQPSDKERADARLVQAQSDQIYIQSGVLSPEEVALARFGGDGYSFETQVDFAARALLDAPEGDVPAAETDEDRPSGEGNALRDAMERVWARDLRGVLGEADTGEGE